MDASNFRDKILSQIIIGYDWDTSNNFAEITLASKDGTISSFKIDKLTEYLLYEDFSSSYINQCKLIITGSNIYLSLDPYDELLNEIDIDKDGL